MAGPTYRHEDIPSITKVQRSIKKPRFARLVSLNPASGKQIPFGLELSAELTPKPGVEGRQEDGNTVIAWGASQFPVGRVDELDGCRRERLGVELVEALFSWLLRRECPSREARGDETGQPVHLPLCRQYDGRKDIGSVGKYAGRERSGGQLLSPSLSQLEGSLAAPIGSFSRSPNLSSACGGCRLCG